MRRLEFRVYGVPAPKGSLQGGGMRCQLCGGSGKTAAGHCPKCHGRGFYSWVHDDNTRTRPWMAVLKAEAQLAVSRDLRGAPLYRGPVHVDLIFWLPKPASLPKRRPSAPTKKPDLDKLARSVLDALTGVLWHDDAQVIGILASKVYGDRPGCQVVAALDDEIDMPELEPAAKEEAF